MVNIFDRIWEKASLKEPVRLTYLGVLLEVDWDEDFGEWEVRVGAVCQKTNSLKGLKLAIEETLFKVGHLI